MYLELKKEPVRIQDIAERHLISRNHLIKIVHELSKNGYVNTTRGPGGGVVLAKPANTITVGEIVRLTEDHMNLVECFGAVEVECKVKKICRLRNLFGKALQAFMEILDKATIADISSNKSEILHALGIPA